MNRYFTLSILSFTLAYAVPLFGVTSLSTQSTEKKEERIGPIRGGKLQKVTQEISTEVVFHRYQDQKGTLNVYLYKKQYIPVPPGSVPLEGKVQFNGEDPVDLEFSSKGDHYRALFKLDKAAENFKVTLTFTVDGSERTLTFDESF